MIGEKFNGLIDRHLQQVVNIRAAVLHIENLLAETFAMTLFTLQYYIGHELHLHHDTALSFADLAAASFLIETEEIGLVSHLFGQWQCTVELANIIVSTYVRDRVGAGAATEIVLIHVLNVSDRLDVPDNALAG